MGSNEILQQAWGQHKAGHLVQADQLYCQVLQTNPRNARALHLRGIIALQTERFPEALAYLRDSCAADPFQVDSQCNLALAYRGLGRLAEAEAALRQAIDLRPDAEVFNNLGTVLVQMGRPIEAEAAWRQTLRLKPDHAEAYNNLGTVLLQLNRPGESEAAFREAVRLAPASARILFNLGAAYQALGRLPQAEEIWRHTLRLQPDHAEALHNLGAVLLELESPAEAEPYLREAVRLRPGQAGALVNLGLALLDLDRTDEAEAHLREALRLQPDSAKAHDAFGRVLLQLGRLDEAERHFREALRCDPGHVAAHSHLATLLCGRLPDSDRQALERLLASGARTEARQGLLFGLAHVCDGRGDYTAAARHLREANALALAAARQRGKGYEPAELRRFLADLRQSCTTEFFQGWRGPKTELPVFVFGLPRSGTTLVEQILASHPQVHGAGELSLAGETLKSLPALLQRRDNPWACAAQLDAANLERLAAGWLDQLRALGKGKPRIVDKMPDNYLYLGWIALMFPRARLIHCRRDLRDVAVSCWITSFRQITWANDPHHIANRFAAYRSVMDHWQQVLPLPILDISYEETVHNLEAVVRRLVAWCGLEWDPACLAFHETRRPVRTASAAQVRQPIHRRAVARWKNYEQELAALFALLPSEGEVNNPALARHGQD